MTRDEADIVISYINALAERTRHDNVMEALQKEGYSEKEVDDSLKALGKVAGRDCGIL